LKHQWISSLSLLIAERVAFTKFYSGIRRKKGFSAAATMLNFEECRRYEEKVLHLVTLLQEEQIKLLHDRKAANIAGIAVFNRALFVIAVSLIILLMLIALTVRYNARLKQRIATKSEELTSIIERITDGFIVLDKDFRCTYANKRIGEMTKRDPSSLLGKNIWGQFPDQIGSVTYNSFNQAIQEQRYCSHIDFNQPLDLWQENHIYPSPDGLSIFVRDITLQKRAEEKLIHSERMYKAIASNIPGSVICLLDMEQRYFLIEGDILEKLGYSKETLLGKRLEEVVPLQRYDDVKHNFTRVFQGETFSIESRVGQFDLSTRYVPLKDEDKKIYAIMLVVIDITELKKAERNVSELNTSLERKISERTHQLAFANKELEAFSYSVAHDLRTPLRAVAGYSTMLIEDYGNQFDDEGRRLLQGLQYHNRKMSNLIDDLLTFSRLGKKEINKSAVDMNGLTESVLSEIGTSSIKIVIDELHPSTADTTLLKQVMINILSNAVKYSSKSAEPTIEISSKREEGMIIYSVRDNGVGFDMKYADKLFGVFQRLHSDEEFDGTGVGLAIVQRIVKRHGGNVWAQAVLGHGATFFFSLPENPSAEILLELENHISL
jgi:PAS domain S-box-containing protein